MNRSLYSFILVIALLSLGSTESLRSQITALNPEIEAADLALTPEQLTADDMEKEAKARLLGNHPAGKGCL